MLYRQFGIKYNNFIAQRKDVERAPAPEEGPNLAHGLLVNNILMHSM